MLRNSTNLHGLSIHAKDGEIGTAEEFYFDDESWAVRYLVVDTGGWLGGRRVLISPISVRDVDWEARRLYVHLTKKQVEDSPDINTHQPVSRQHEAEYMGYYGYPSYWAGTSMWGPGYYPGGLFLPAETPAELKEDQIRRESADSHLRSSDAVQGYRIHAADGEIGHVHGFLVDDETWAIRYIEVATRNWWPGKKVLVSPAWIDRVSWLDSTFSTHLTKEAIKSAPEYDESSIVTRDYEERLHLHYGRPRYWLHDV
jgi:hypothetical protein